MPELPEVEALCSALDGSLRRRVVVSTLVRSVAALKTFDPPISATEGLTVAGVRRAGKFVVIELAPLHLVVHLARAGWIRHVQRPTKARPSLRGPLVMVSSLDDGSALEVTEQGTEKRLAVYLVRSLSHVPGIEHLGVDALDPSLDTARLGEVLRAAPGTLKSALADQGRIAGIGNAYSDEILHAARLSPFRRAALLKEEEVAALFVALRTVLGDAAARAAEVEPSALRGDKKRRMQVHGRTGQPCPVCGDTVREVALATRSFQYCPTCQTGGRVYADRRLSRLLR